MTGRTRTAGTTWAVSQPTEADDWLPGLIADETNGTISDREVTVKKAVWSPSGMSSLGGWVPQVAGKGAAQADLAQMRAGDTHLAQSGLSVCAALRSFLAEMGRGERSRRLVRSRVDARSRT